MEEVTFGNWLVPQHSSLETGPGNDPSFPIPQWSSVGRVDRCAGSRTQLQDIWVVSSLAHDEERSDARS